MSSGATHAISWSSGKDSCLALWKAISSGLDVEFLLNTYWRQSDRGAWHGVRVELIQEQARRMGMPLLQKGIGENEYEERFVDALLELREKGVATIIFGDIEPLENRRWCERVCEKAGVRSFFPLWGMPHKQVVQEFIESGFEAVVVSVDSRVLGKEELGKEIDADWIAHLEDLRRERPSLSVCGENGEFHSFVYGGPLFKSHIPFALGKRHLIRGNWTIDLVPRKERRSSTS